VAKRRRKQGAPEASPAGEGEARAREPRPKQYDATFKDLAQERPVDMLGTFDAPSAEPVEVLNVDLSTVTTEADVVFGIGKPLREVVHLDAQAGPDADLHRNVLVYNALLHRIYKVPVHSIVILLRPQAQHRNLTGSVRYQARPGRGMEFGYEIVRLWQVPAETLLTGPLGAVPLAALGKLPDGLSEEEGLALVVRRLVERILRDASGGQAKRLLVAAFILTGLHVEREDVRRLFQGAKAMRESDTFQAILEEGRVEEAHRLLLVVGRERFGKPNKATRQAIEGITDLQRLERLAAQLVHVSSWEGLLGIP
jgi:hypothetical protein